MKISETMTVFVKEDNKWIISSVSTDKTEIYKNLMDDLVHKKLHKCSYIKSIKDICNYDGTRTIITYYDNGVKRVYIVKT